MSSRNDKKAIWRIIGISCGILIVLMGIGVLSLEKAEEISRYTEFGGDYQTYSYRAMVVAANNMKELYEVIKLGIGLLLISLGLGNICYWGSITVKRTESREEAHFKTCPQCYSVEEIDAVFCTHCGTKFPSQAHNEQKTV